MNIRKAEKCKKSWIADCLATRGTYRVFHWKAIVSNLSQLEFLTEISANIESSETVWSLSSGDEETCLIKHYWTVHS